MSIHWTANVDSSIKISGKMRTKVKFVLNKPIQNHWSKSFKLESFVTNKTLREYSCCIWIQTPCKQWLTCLWDEMFTKSRKLWCLCEFLCRKKPTKWNISHATVSLNPAAGLSHLTLLVWIMQTKLCNATEMFIVYARFDRAIQSVDVLIFTLFVIVDFFLHFDIYF